MLWLSPSSRDRQPALAESGRRNAYGRFSGSGGGRWNARPRRQIQPPQGHRSRHQQQAAGSPKANLHKTVRSSTFEQFGFEQESGRSHGFEIVDPHIQCREAHRLLLARPHGLAHHRQCNKIHIGPGETTEKLSSVVLQKNRKCGLDNQTSGAGFSHFPRWGIEQISDAMPAIDQPSFRSPIPCLAGCFLRVGHTPFLRTGEPGATRPQLAGRSARTSLAWREGLTEPYAFRTLPSGPTR